MHKKLKKYDQLRLKLKIGSFNCWNRREERVSQH